MEHADGISVTCRATRVAPAGPFALVAQPPSC